VYLDSEVALDKESASPITTVDSRPLSKVGICENSHTSMEASAVYKPSMGGYLTIWRPAAFRDFQ